MLADSQEGLLYDIVIHCDEIYSNKGGIFKAGTEISVLMKLCVVPCHKRGYVN
jgi:hypothetical protein